MNNQNDNNFLSPIVEWSVYALLRRSVGVDSDLLLIVLDRMALVLFSRFGFFLYSLHLFLCYMICVELRARTHTRVCVQTVANSTQVYLYGQHEATESKWRWEEKTGH